MILNKNVGQYVGMKKYKFRTSISFLIGTWHQNIIITSNIDVKQKSIFNSFCVEWMLGINYTVEYPITEELYKFFSDVNPNIFYKSLLTKVDQVE